MAKAPDVSILTAGNVTVCQHVSAPSLANHQLFHFQPPVLGPNQVQIRLQWYGQVLSPYTADVEKS